MKRYFLLIPAFFTVFQVVAKKQTKVERPKLVVGIVIDQMRWDYLYRYNDLYGNGGFKRLMKDGFNCQNTMINYLPSFTAPGHSCIYSGSVPSIHGIAANDWVDNFKGKSVYCTDDTVHEVNNGVVGATSMSPRNLLVTTITDELRLATNFHSRTYGISIKDRGAILPAGHLANGAYWLDDTTGSFCSSTYYKNTNPAWLQTFNKRRLADSLIKLTWTLLDPTGKIYTQSLADDNRYEGKFKGELTPVFPHDLNKLKGKDRYNSFKATPGGNYLTLQMAIACRDGEHMGESEETDFLAVSFSSTDYTGHLFGPNSIEVEDAYLRLDMDIAALLNYLDKTVGKGDYLVFLTADHGAAHNPQFLADNAVPAGFVSGDLKKELNIRLKNEYGYEKIISHYTNYQFYLNDSLITTANLDRNKIKETLTTLLNAKPELQYVVDMENLNRTAVPEPIRTMLVNGYYRGRSGSIQVIPAAGWFEGHSKTGTTHGTWNPYDAHIPLLWYGWNIPKGETNEVVNMTDISATLAALLHIQMPNGCVGKPIIMAK